MKKYIIDIINLKYNERGLVDASTKPTTDFDKIAYRLGYEHKVVYSRESPVKVTLFVPLRKLLNGLYYYKEYLRMLSDSLSIFKIKESIVLLQYPFQHNIMEQVIIPRLRKNNNKIVVLFHDLNELRWNEKQEAKDPILRYTDFAIFHTPEMEKKTAAVYGVTPPSVCLEFFDYLNTFTREANVDKDDIKVLYAGNLIKSEFLKDIHRVQVHDDMQFLIYGKPENAAPEGTNIVYKGSFNSEEISAVEGNWGLVWDGTSIETCAGPLGEYLRINAPFKFSMSLALGIPVVVWSQSALAQYVKKYHLGICVDKLDDIYGSIKGLSPEEIDLITKGVKTYSYKVRNGQMLENSLQAAEEYLNLKV